MRNLIILFVCLFGAHAMSAQVKLEDIVKPGTKLIYGVNANGSTYDFIVTVVKLKPAVEFKWEMTAPINIEGTIIHTAKAMKSGNTMYNYFSPGSKTLDDNTLSVWLSQNVFEGMNKTGKGIEVKMNTDAESKGNGHIYRK